MSIDRVYTTRRDFLTGSLSLVSAAATIPVFLGSTARVFAQNAPPRKRRHDDERILVVLQLAGGNDGLNTVIPFEMDGYYQNRRQLAIAKKDVLKLEKGVGLHPAATGLKALFDDGKMAIIQGVGYPNPNRSHFTSMDIWQTADPNQRAHSGWIGRYFDSCCKGSDPEPEPISGIALMNETPLAMQGDRFMPLAFNDADSLTWRAGNQDKAAADVFRRLNNTAADLPAKDRTLADFLQRSALEAQLGSDEIRSAGASAAGDQRRGGRRVGGNAVGQQLQMVAKMIAAGLPTRIYYVSMGGFDTHSGQLQRHQQLMTQLGNAVQGFLETLEDDGLLDRVLVMTFSEFGRRVQENASGGTDHGEAAPMFLFGSAVKPGLHEKHPDLSSLHRGDLSFGVDFRRVYATVVRQWLNAKPDKIIGGGFQPMPLLKPNS